MLILACPFSEQAHGVSIACSVHPVATLGNLNQPLKLCRFELIASPERVRSGIVYSGKIYETDGANPVGVHEAADVRPLSPVGRIPSLRFFRNPDQMGLKLDNDEAESLPYYYGNPSSVLGPSHVFPKPEYVLDLQAESYLAAIVATNGRNVPVEHADDMILGFTLLTQFVARNVLDRSPSARAFDFGCALGPVVTTPDEIAEKIVDSEFGQRYNLNVVSRLNGVERARGEAVDLPITFAQALSVLSQGAPLVEGDVVALGPIAVWSDTDPSLDQDDEIQLAVENLGTLSAKVGLDAPLEDRS